MYFKQLFGILGIILLLSACTENKKKPIDTPKVLIPKEKMAEILSEVQLIEAYLNQIPYSKRGKSDSDYVYYPMLFEKYHITKNDFLKNLAYYSHDEETIKALYEQSIIRLNKLKAKDLEIRLEMKMDSIRQDSIQKVKDKARLDSLRLLLKKPSKRKKTPANRIKRK
jgi:hypothetical protein